MTLRTVIVGFGSAADTLGADTRMARHFPKGCHAAVLAEHPAFDWTAVVDPTEVARGRARHAWGIAEAVPSLAKLADPERYDCAVIATPPEHRGGVLDALPNLKAVVVEKPVGSSIAAAEAFARDCSRRGIAAQVNYWRRGVPGFRALAEGGLHERIGTPRAVFGTYGGGLYNSGSHLIDFVRFLMGEVADVIPAASWRLAADSPLAGDVAAEVALTLVNGAPVRLLPTDFREYREVSLDVWGSAGRLSIEQESLVTRAFRLTDNRGLEGAREIASDRPVPLDIPTAEAFVRLYDNLVEAATTGAALWSPLDSALETERLLSAVAGRSDSMEAKLHA